MGYPLGSFPRFGHQERRATERRQRALANSAATRRWKKEEALNAEKCFFNWLVENFWVNPQGKDVKDVKGIKAINRKKDSIERSLLNDKRVYWKRLGVLCREIFINISDECFDVISKTFIVTVRQIRLFSDEKAAAFAEEMGSEEYGKIKYGFSIDDEESEPPAPAVAAPAFEWRPPTAMEYICVMMGIWFVAMLVECAVS